MSDQWQQIEHLFAEAKARPAADRAAWLDVHAPDPAIRAEVQSLLAYLPEGTGIAEFRDVIRRVSSTALLANDAARVGDSIGAYRLTRVIGQGGMGTVYLAVRDDAQFHKQVAIKIIRHDMATPEMVERFRHERQILARLEHPHIARLFDGGTAPGGLPYLVMEFVEGVGILDWCQRRTLALDERLRLFVDACSAVDYAHRNLVIHRDLKASNILVTDEGSAKLLDFGVARLIEPRGAANTMTASTGLTPAYASPEQLRGDAVTTATDVYSLGVLLYVLLTGRLPYVVSPSAGVYALEQAIETTPPPLPSLAAPADARQLRGDVDAIVLTAMHKDIARRYPSVGALAADVRAFMDGRPVSARRDTSMYRLGKFVRRNRMLTATAAVAILSIVAGLAVSIRQTQRANRRFEDVRSIARRIIVDFDPLVREVPGTVEARKLLTGTATEYLDRLRDDAGDDPALLREIADGYLRTGMAEGSLDNPNQGNYAAAMRSYEKSLAIAAELDRRGRFDAALAGLMAQANLRIGEIVSVTTSRDAAMARYLLAADAAHRGRRIAPKDERLIGVAASAGNRQGDLLFEAGRIAEAARRFEQSIAQWTAVGPPPVNAVTTRARLGMAQRELGNLEEALQTFVTCIDDVERELGKARSSPYENVLTQLHADAGRTLADPDGPSLMRVDQGIAQYRAALAAGARYVAASSNEPHSRVTLAEAHVAFGTLLAETSTAEAVTLLRHAIADLEPLRSTLATTNLELMAGRAQSALSRALSRSGRFAEARRAGDTAAAILQAQIDRDPASTPTRDALVVARLHFASALAGIGDSAAAEAQVQLAITLADASVASTPERQRARFLQLRARAARGRQAAG